MMRIILWGVPTPCRNSTFSESMQATPTFSLSGGLLTNQELYPTVSSSAWYYIINLSSFPNIDGTYRVTVAGNDPENPTPPYLYDTVSHPYPIRGQ